MKKSLLALLAISCLIFVGLTTADDYTKESFESKLNSLEDQAKIVELFKDYIENSSDMDLVRAIQSQWEANDAEGVRSFMKELHEKNPTSATFAYLYGRVVESPVEQVKLGRKAIEQSMLWPYGYRLVTATYMQNLFEAGPEDEYVAELKAMLPEDEKDFATLIQLEPEEDYPLQFNLSYQKYIKDTDGALATLDKAKEMGARWASPIQYGTIYAMQGNFDKALSTITEFIDAQGVSPDERQQYIDYYYRNGLVGAGAHDAAIDYFKAKSDFATNDEAQYDVACLYAIKGEKDNAFAALTGAISAGFDKVENAKNDGDLAVLTDDPRWETAIADIQKNWDNGKPKRKAEALAAKVSEPAPDWSLEDKDGNIVKLADLRGSVLVLDFWATWCGPCRMAMPVIDKFVKEGAKDGVKVYSINVWERTPGKAMPLKFMQDNNYAMTLLYGDKDLTTAYGIQGIPFICVIDKDGNIAYKESGYSEKLGENLVWWTESLL
ncbi:MAG: TlpA disulfide reductase family protein [Candidatus Zixiibacteriota bacterium]